MIRQLDERSRQTLIQTARQHATGILVYSHNEVIR